MLSSDPGWTLGSKMDRPATPPPGHKANRAPWAAGAGGHPELGRVTGGARGGTRPDASAEAFR